jgi:hypothetical protein
MVGIWDEERLIGWIEGNGVVAGQAEQRLRVLFSRLTGENEKARLRSR